jgi:hypothetical protein
MRFNVWFIAGFAAAITAARHPAIVPRSDAVERALLTLPAIKTSLGTLKSDLQKLDSLFNAITASNVESQLDTINKHLKKMNTDAGTQTRKLTSSGEIKINELLSFLNSNTQKEWITLVVDLLGVANSTITDVAKKREIIKASGKADTIAEGLRLQKDSVLKIWDASLTQFPSMVKSMFGLSGGSSGKGKGKGKSSKSSKSGKSSGPLINLGDPALREKIGSSVGDLFDQVIDYLKGTKDSISLPFPTAAPGAASKGSAAPKGKSKSAGKAKSKNVAN